MTFDEAVAVMREHGWKGNPHRISSDDVRFIRTAPLRITDRLRHEVATAFMRPLIEA